MPTIIKLTVATAAALLGLTVDAGRARADDVPLPTAQAKAMHAEFLTQAPTPPTPGVTCIVDTGVNSNYDTDAAVVGRESIYPGDGSDGDPNAHHGTYLAMNIAAPANGWGMVGIAPQTRVLSIRAIESGAHTFQSQSYTQGLDGCWQEKANNGVNVTTALLALGHAETDASADGQQVQTEITFLRSHGIAVVAAAGNDGGAVQWPARYSPVFAVGGVDTSGGFCDSSSRGPELDLSGLGCGDDAALWDSGSPAMIEGTSTSAALVAGVLTALRAYKPELTPDQAELLLSSTADSSRGGKVLNASAAFKAAGLDAIVDAYHAPAPEVPPAPAVINLGTICPDGGVLSCQKPKLANVTRERGKTTLTVATLPAGSFLEARVSRRWHNSRTPTVTLRVGRWKKIIVRFGSLTGERSPALTIRPRDLRHTHKKRQAGL